MTSTAFKNIQGMQELYESVEDSRSLLVKLNKELSSYSVFDLMKIQAILEKECKYLPEKYKRILKKKMAQQLIQNFRAILSNQLSPNVKLDKDIYCEFLKIFQKKIDSLDENDDLRLTVLYHLFALYNIFVSRTPPHPEGTPFPGGFFVEKVGEEYYCPVKDKQSDNDEALCRFCIAKQSKI